MFSVIILFVVAFVAVIAQTIIDIFAQIAAFFGLEFTTILALAVTITIVVNYLKATLPFSNWVKDETIPYFTGAITLLVCAITMWGMWVQIIVSAALITVLSIGGWAGAKMIAHKMGTSPSNKSGGR